MSRALLMMSLVALTACGPDGLPLDPAQVASKRDAVVGGRVTFDDPAVFALFGPGWLCSSTLIGRRTLLTASHCVLDESTNTVVDPGYFVATNVADANHARGSDYFRVTAVRSNPNFRFSDLVAGNDIAMVQLEREPPVPTKPWNRDPLTQAMAFTPIREVGYGITGAGLNDSGLKRSGATVLRVIDTKEITFGRDAQNGGCSGDSGGPALKVFPDGSERVIGIASFGTSGQCGVLTDTRVDFFRAWVQTGLDLYEGSCAEDGVCKAGCTPVDPDCACVADGQCNAACTGLTLDPDCSNSCGVAGVCSTTMAGCGGADPDCGGLGELCGYDGHCASRMCITSAQHARPYCSQTCTGPSDCPATMDCVSNRCELKLRPSASQGEACVLGTTLCDSPALFCAGWSGHPDTTCMLACYEDADCPQDSLCRPSPQAPGVCVANILVPKLTTEISVVKGCASAPGELLTGLLALLALRRRR